MKVSPVVVRSRRRWLKFVSFVVVVLLVAIGWKGWRLYALAESLHQDMQSLQALSTAPPDSTTLPTLGPLLADVQRDTQALHDEAALFFPLTRRLGWLPRYGADITAIEPGLAAAVSLTAAVEDAFAALAPLASSFDSTASLTDMLDLAEALAQARPQLEQARAAVEQAARSWEDIPADSLSPELQRPMQRVEPLLPLLDASIKLLIAVDETANALGPLARELENGPELSPALVTQLHQSRAAIEQSRVAIEQAAAAWQTVPVADLPPPLQAQFQRAAPIVPLLEASVDLTIAADETAAVLVPILLERDNSRPLTVAAAEQLSAAGPALVRAQLALDQAAASLARVSPEGLPGPLRERLQQINTLLPLAREGLDGAALLPYLLGADGRREYLIVAQNPDERRATGGFIGSAGPLVFEGGHLAELTMQPTDEFVPAVYPPPPEPIQRYMGINVWVFRDANWSPDFPTSARDIVNLYAIQYGRSFSNVIAINPMAVQLLLEATGPVTVEGSADVVSAENLMQYMQDQYSLAFQGGPHRKAFIGPLMQSIMLRVQTMSSAEELFALARVFKRILDERHMQIAVQEPEIAALLARHHWDGSLQPDTNDFLMLVDTNMGPTKVDPSIQREVGYQVDLSNPAAPAATLAVRYTNQAHGAGGECRQQGYPVSRYEDYQTGCFWNYMRAFIPYGSRLLAATTQPVPGAWLLSGVDEGGSVTLHAGEQGTYVLGTFMVVPMGSAQTSTFRYLLPTSVLTRTEQGWQYRLVIQKQSGSAPLPVNIQITLPPGAVLLSASQPPTIQAREVLSFSLTQHQDQALDLLFSSE